ncbi:glucose-6-phosphate dehydrogenase assembly protein OpcA [Scrofimicrobium sp. R131]|uniref:Glucose-6-phosphate dehydrogenase assembly protein OpcA n=1 Tax=Scrofimicrobium appendicitidis TaxID=3079930 RepID=A0AAU7V942_9ACTO
MIINLPRTTIRDINRRLLLERDEGGAIALGRVLTLIIDAGDRDPEGAIDAARDASLEHPCRVIVLTRADTVRGAELDAQIRLGGDAGASEVIILRTSGELDEHVDTLVVPLLLPDAPIVVWWPYQAPTNPSQHPLGKLAARRITDSTECDRPAVTLNYLGRHYREGDTDLAWTRATRWRGLLAATLDQPPFEPVQRVVIAGEGTHPSLDLLGAWLGWALRCPVEIIRQDTPLAITQVRLERASGPIVLDRPDGREAILSQPGQPSHRIALPIRELRECLAEELRRLDADEVYGEVLQDGLQLLEDQP